MASSARQEGTSKKHKDKKKTKKKDKHESPKERKRNRKEASTEENEIAMKKERKSEKKKRKHDRHTDDHYDRTNDESKKSKKTVDSPPLKANIQNLICRTIPPTKQKRKIPFDYKYILAPMVGASELAFRLLCRKYGTQLAYTPMISSDKFVSDAAYRNTELPRLSPQDRPLVAHFASNSPQIFAEAAKLVQSLDLADAIDLNLGCPQRTAYVGHFGSYLLDACDRELILEMLKQASSAVTIPIFAKIRLLDTVEDTLELCEQLRDAGASLIAVHARYRASFERKGPGARDGPALLDQVKRIKEVMGDSIPIISNGNVISYGDVESNLQFTRSDGIMSAEGILDNPALFLPRFGRDDESTSKEVKVTIPNVCDNSYSLNGSNEDFTKKKRKWMKKMREIQKIEEKIETDGEVSINSEQKRKLATKVEVKEALASIEAQEKAEKQKNCNTENNESSTIETTLDQLYQQSKDSTSLALEYLSLVKQHPIQIRSVIFHIRRMCRDILNEYQLMEECISCQTLPEIETIVQKCRQYRSDPGTFHYDREKALRAKQALEKKKMQEKNRKRFEERMMRKAKREGKSDLEFYLRQGSEVPTMEDVKRIRAMCAKQERLDAWKERFSQHCMSYHLEKEGCKRDRSCAFLHVDARGSNVFDEEDEVAG